MRYGPRHRLGALLGTLAFVTVACGGATSTNSADSADSALPVPTVNEPAATAQPAESSNSAAPAAPVETPDSGADGTSATDTTAPSPPAETAPAESSTSAAPQLGGRALSPDAETAALFAGNPFPDLVVDDVGRNAKVNIANLLPSDRPVLVWAWAPH